MEYFLCRAIVVKSNRKTQEMKEKQNSLLDLFMIILGVIGLTNT